MFLTVHTPTSLIIGTLISNPFLAFVLAFIFHLILDIPPHHPKAEKDWVFTLEDKKKRIKRYLMLAIPDMIGVIVVLFILWKTHNLALNYSMLAALFGGYLPDFLWAIDDLFKNKIKILNLYHKKINTGMHKIIIKDFFVALPWAILSQFITFILTLWIYLRII